MNKLNQTLVAITTDIGPLWDARNDLVTLTGILGAVLYLSAPDDEDPAKADIIQGLVTVQETVARCADQLHAAIKEGTVKQEKEATSRHE